MNWDHLFLAANAVALSAWGLLLFGILWGRKLTSLVRLIAALLAAAYLLLFLYRAGAAAILVRDYSIAGVQGFFAHPELALAGWIHYLVLDLWLGTWEVDTAPAAMPRPLLILVLLMTLAIGPIGLCAFLAARSWAGRRRDPQEKRMDSRRPS